ncbi:MAG: T9SS type A sorting domain-containing protein [Bacteroidota bacterium]
MKKIATILFLSSTLISWAQGPIIEATYLPVRGTAISEIWDVSSTNIMVPDTGQNKSWNYAGQFTYPTPPYKIRTFHPDTLVNGLSFSQYFPTATHASFLTSPLNNLTDSLYSYYIIDAGGLHMLGGFNIRAQTANNAGYDTTSIITPSELMTPDSVTYGMVRNDISSYITYGRYSNIPIKIKGTRNKVMKGVGYGTLTIPNGTTFTNVVLARQIIHTVDSVFMAGSNTFMTVLVSDYIDYSFLRNNTFGSSYLMYLNANSGNTLINYGWYTLPVDFGSISGTVYESEGSSITTTNGEALLYRENSNFSKNDILDRSILDGSGNYQFDSIPYGEYRVAIRADSASHPNVFTTYYGDTSNWLDATPIITTANSTGNDIYLQYHAAPDPNGGEIQGHIGLDLDIRTIDPIPGVDIVVRKNPGGIAVQEVTTDANGDFSLEQLPPLVAPFTTYDLFVDIPGLHMSGTYDIIVISGTVVNALDFTVGTDSIHPNSEFVGIKEYYTSDNLMGAYPNPYSSNTTIKINLSERCDVLLEVYNLLGEKIKTLDNTQKLSGIHYYNFNAKSLNFPAGIYIVKLSAGDKISVLKIIEQ